MKLKKEVLKQLEEDLAKTKDPKEIFSSNGPFKSLIQSISEELLQQELEEHLGYGKHASSGRGSGNNRNGTSSKTVYSDYGPVDIDIPRDRNGEFEPELIPKHQKDIGGFEHKVVSMYAKGMSTRDIQEHLKEIYGIHISASTISRMTERILSLAEAWQNRPLEEMYVIVYFDAIFFKVHQEGSIRSKAAYTCIGINNTGHKD